MVLIYLFVDGFEHVVHRQSHYAGSMHGFYLPCLVDGFDRYRDDNVKASDIIVNSRIPIGAGWQSGSNWGLLTPAIPALAIANTSPLGLVRF